MSVFKKEVVFEWIEPNYFSRLRNRFEKRERVILNIRKILCFSFLFILLMYMWSRNNVVLGIRLSYILAILVYFTLSIFIVFLINLLEKFIGTKIEITENNIIRKTGEGRHDSWYYDKISKCKIKKGITKGKKYVSLNLYRNNKLLAVIFLQDKISIEQIKKFLLLKNIDCVYSDD